MAKLLNPEAESAFAKTQAEAAQETMLTLAYLCNATPKQLADGGYGTTQDEAIVTQVRIAVRVAKQRADEFLASQR